MPVKVKVEKQIKRQLIGSIAFYLGIILAIILGIIPQLLPRSTTILLLGILGIVVGLLNIEESELNRYLLANVAFLVGGSALNAVLAELPLGVYTNILIYIIQNIVVFVAPGAAVVALKAIYEVTKSPA